VSFFLLASALVGSQCFDGLKSHWILLKVIGVSIDFLKWNPGGWELENIW
jgi:hypothetical protein